jgi:molecular chaperone GrpE
MEEKNLDEDNIPVDNENDNYVDEVATLKDEVANLKERILRSSAELENMRKRNEKQIDEVREYAISGFAKDLLNVVDNFSRALAHKPDNMSEELKNIIQGVEMINSELHSVLKKHHVKVIETNVGDRFDYNVHQAIAKVPTDKYAQGSIVDIMQIGYKLKERLLRPVIVAIAEAADEQTDKNDEETS